MSPVDGEPAGAGDIWLRVITDEKYFKPDGTLKNNAFTGKAIAQPDQARPWRLELSGALRSLIDNLNGYGDSYCGDKFAGFMFQKVGKIRSDNPRIDVIYTPRDGDVAHADVVLYDLEDKYAIRDWLQEVILCVRACDCDEIDQYGAAE